jgi:hypothetical protein
VEQLSCGLFRVRWPRQYRQRPLQSRLWLEGNVSARKPFSAPLTII